MKFGKKCELTIKGKSLSKVAVTSIREIETEILHKRRDSINGGNLPVYELAWNNQLIIRTKIYSCIK